MSVRPAPSWSIHRRVLAWLFLAMTLVFSANLLSSYYSNIKAADRAFDRLLLASASAIAERSVLREDGLHVDIPYVALDMLASTAQDRVFYAVSAPDGKVVTGYENLPLPKRRDGEAPQDPVFYNSVFKQASVRIVPGEIRLSKVAPFSTLIDYIPNQLPFIVKPGCAVNLGPCEIRPGEIRRGAWYPMPALRSPARSIHYRPRRPTP